MRSKQFRRTGQVQGLGPSGHVSCRSQAAPDGRQLASCHWEVLGRLCFGPTGEAGLPTLIIEPRLQTGAFSLHSATPSQLIPPGCSLSAVRGGPTTPSNAGLPASSPWHLEEEVFPATSSSRLHKCRWCGKWGSSRTNQEARFGLPAPHVARP